MPELITCPKCNEDVNVVSIKCPHCGYSMLESKPTTTTTNGPILILWFIGVSVIIFVIMMDFAEGITVGPALVISLFVALISTVFLRSGDSSYSNSSSDQYRALSAIQREQQRKELNRINEELDEMNDHTEE